MNIALAIQQIYIITVDGAGNIVISSVIGSVSGSTPFSVSGSGAGRLDLTGTSNTFTGNINLNGPEVRFSGCK
jgi:autotransporter-associated beta strand protein